MAKVQYVSFVDIISRAYLPPAFNSISNGYIGECGLPRLNTDELEKVVEIIDNIETQLHANKDWSERLMTQFASLLAGNVMNTVWRVTAVDQKLPQGYGGWHGGIWWSINK